MKGLVAFCLDRPVTTLMIHVTLILLGVLAVTRLPLNSMPRSERPVISVRVDYPNASPQQVEREVTKKLEEVLATLSGVNSMESESEPEESRVTLRFDWGANLDLLKVDVRERIARIRHELPVDDLERIRIAGHRNSGDAIIKGRISSKEIDLSQNYELLLHRIRRPLERIEGVSQVELEGVTPHEILVTFRPESLEEFGLDLDDVVRRLREHNSNRTVGRIVHDGTLRRLRVVAGFRTVEDVRAFPLSETGLRLGQIAEVEQVPGELRFGRHLDGTFAVSIEVFKESNANTVGTCERVLAAIERMADDPELGGIVPIIWENQGKEILGSLEGLRNTGLIGSLLALVILWLFLRRGTATLLVGMSIPISVLSALAWLYILGRELNILSIVALMLGVGMLVDTAVVVVESIVRLAGQGVPPREAARRGTLEVSTPIFVATLTSIIVFVPVALGSSSQMTDMLKELGLVISLTLGTSLFVSLTLIPMVSARIYRTRVTPTGPVFARVRNGYERVLRGALTYPWTTIVIATCLVSSCILPFRGKFKLNLEDRSEIIKNASVFYRPEGSIDFRVMERHVDAVEAVLDAARASGEIEYENVYSWYKDNFAWTAIYPGQTFTEKELAAYHQKIDAILPVIPGVSVKTGSWGSFWGRRGSRSAGTRQVRVFGESSDQIALLIEDLQGRLEGVNGIVSTEVRHRDQVDEVRVTPTDDQLTYLGLSAREVSSQVSAYFGGRTIREVRTADGDVPLKIRIAEGERNSLRHLEELEMRTGDGRELPLQDVGEIRIDEGAGELRREERQSTGSLTVQFAADAVADADSILFEALGAYDWPKGYGFDVGSGRRQRQQNESQFKETLLLAVFLVFLVMACLFESLLQPVLLMLTVVLAIPGVIWFLAISGDELDQPAAIGLILLAGIVVNNGIVFVDHINRYRAQGMEAVEAILRGGRERLRPILITALTTVLGLVPMAYAAEIASGLSALGLPVSGIGGAQAAGMYYFTLARTIIGGLTVSTVLTLVVLPVFYLLTARFTAPRSVVLAD